MLCSFGVVMTSISLAPSGRTFFFFLVGLCVAGGLSSGAHAAASLQTDVVLELQSEQTTDADLPGQRQNNTFARAEVAPVLDFGNGFTIDGVLVFEPVLGPDPAGDNYFEDHGLFIEELKLNYSFGRARVFAGKYNPPFGIAWDFGRGIWSEDFAEDYEVTEKIGFGGSYDIADRHGGTHSLIAGTFFADTTLLSESALQGRGNTTRSDGGVSNTEDFASFVLALEGQDPLGLDGAWYKLGYRHQAAGDATPGQEDENGFVVSLGRKGAVHEDVTLDGLVEYASIDDFAGTMNTRRYLSASLVALYQQRWNITLGYTMRDIDVAAGDNIDDHLFQLSGGYDFGQGTTAEIGWRVTETAGADRDIIGGLVRHNLSF